MILLFSFFYVFTHSFGSHSSDWSSMKKEEWKVEGVCLWMDQYVDGNSPQRQAMLQSARWQWSMKDELRNKRKYTTIHSSFVYVGALAVQPTESTKWKLVIELPAVLNLKWARFREVPRTRTRNKSHRKYEPGIGALFVQPHHHWAWQ